MKVRITRVDTDRRIQSIKDIRALTGLGLKESKDISDSFMHGATGAVVEAVPNYDPRQQFVYIDVEPMPPTFADKVEEYAAIVPDMPLREFARFLRVAG